MQKLSDLFVLTDEQRKYIGLSIVTAIAALEPPKNPDAERTLIGLYRSLDVIDHDEYKLQLTNHGRVK